jgi:CheY-like chemotaxis protein
VILAVNGKEAVDKFRDDAERISAVLLDLTMPVMSGEEAFHEIQNIRSNVPIVLSSGYTEQDVAKRFTGKGPAGFVQKPYAIMDLVKKFHTLLHEVP